jgi:hypothetical protein
MKNFWEEGIFENINPKYIALIILPMIVWFLYNTSKMSNVFLQNENRLKSEINDEFKGVIIEKAKDTFNRYSPYIKFYREQKFHIDNIIWQKVKVGDTLEKTKGSSTLKIKSRDTIILIDYKDIYKYWDSIYKNE